MKRPNYSKIVTAFLITIWCICGSSVLADVRLPSVIGSNMVLQRDRAIPIWGWADAGEGVTVEFAGQKVGTTACEEGKWMVKLAAVDDGERQEHDKADGYSGRRGLGLLGPIKYADGSWFDK